MIYFIRDTASGLVKIGFSDNPWNRLVKAQADCPTVLAVVGMLEGDRSDEAALHARFAGQRVHGEWFAPHDALGELIGALPRPATPPTKRKRLGKRKNPKGLFARWMLANDETDAAFGARVGLSVWQVQGLRLGDRYAKRDEALRLQAATGIHASVFIRAAGLRGRAA